jgi:hypothetical protein
MNVFYIRKILNDFPEAKKPVMDMDKPEQYKNISAQTSLDSD